MVLVSVTVKTALPDVSLVYLDGVAQLQTTVKNVTISAYRINNNTIITHVHQYIHFNALEYVQHRTLATCLHKKIWFFSSANKFFHLIAMDELFDGDSNTYKIVKAKEPYVQVQLHTSTKINQLDVTLNLGKY